jgi:uncharacterized membrane protein YfcA
VIAVAIVGGIVVGLTLGALGGGGAIVTVPVLVYGLGQAPSEATTAALVIVAVSAAVAMVVHARDGNVRFQEGLVFGLLGTGGTVVGARLAVGVSPTVLLGSFAALLVVVAVLMWRRAGRPAPEQHRRPPMLVLRPRFRCECPQVALLVATTLGVGLLTGFFGVGGGFAIVPALVMVLGFSMPQAVGTSLLVIVVNSLTALATRVGSGVSLDWAVVAVFTAGAVAGSLIGQRASGRLPASRLQRTFAGLLVAVAGYVALRTAGVA